MHKRPVSVIVIGCLYIAVGVMGFVYHLGDLSTGNVFRYDAIWIELVRLLAIVCGAFLLRGENWARWVALAWIGFHVVVSAFHSLPELAVHCLFCAAIAWALFRRDSVRYFHGA